MEQHNTNFSYCNEFFRVFLSNQASHRLNLPPAFIKRLNGIIPKNVTLKDYTGKIWDVELEKAEKDVVIACGWKDFVTFHALINGDFLSFKYDGYSHFDVELYAKNGLKKAKAPDHVKEQQETEEGHIDSRTTTGGGGTSTFQKFHGTEKAAVALQRASSFKSKSKNPCFMIVMKSSHLTPRYLLTLPIWFTMEFLSKSEGDIILNHSDGRSWDTRYHKSLSRRTLRARLQKGWPAFVRDNHLQVGDVCVFELIKANKITLKFCTFRAS